MLNALSQDDYNGADLVYRGGVNSRRYDDKGKLQLEKRTLQSLSTEARDDFFDKDLTFAFQTYGLAGKDVDAIDDHKGYGDEFVRNALMDPRSGSLAGEAAVALNLWMYSVHSLWESFNACEMAAYVSSYPAAGFGFDKGSIIRAYDEAMAYYVGADQQAGTRRGFAVYALAQKAGSLFEKNKDRQMNVNLRMSDLFERGHGIFSEGDPCSEDGLDTLEELWGVVNGMISLMTIPLVQMLIHSMKSEDQARVKMYALAVIPQASSCKTSAYRMLKQNLLEQTYNPDKFADILTNLQSIYDCLGITCLDVGAYRETEVAQCAERPDNLPMAGYSPSTNVFQQAKIDLDIQQIEIMASLEKYSIASHIYNFGRNSIIDETKFRSLKSFATDPNRMKVEPLFQQFQDYHNQKNYADNIVQQTLDGEGKWNNATPQQRTEIIVTTIKAQIMFMYILSEMQDAVSDCDMGDFNDNAGGAHSWDEVAAYMIGSLEDVKTGGGDDTEDGQMFWNLANTLCEEFDTCNKNGYSILNAEIENLLYAGKAELNSYDCTNMYHTIKKLTNMLIIPLIQSVFRYAVILDSLPPDSTDKEVATAEAFALSVIPIIASYEPEAANIVARNMISEPGVKPVADGPVYVSDAFFTVLDDFDLKCDYVGRDQAVDGCALTLRSTFSAATSRRMRWLDTALVLGVTFFSGLAAFL